MITYRLDRAVGRFGSLTLARLGSVARALAEVGQPHATRHGIATELLDNPAAPDGADLATYQTWLDAAGPEHLASWYAKLWLESHWEEVIA